MHNFETDWELERDGTLSYIRSIASEGFDAFDDAIDGLFAEVEEDLEVAENSIKQAQEELEQHIKDHPEDTRDYDVHSSFLFDPYNESWSKGEQLESLAEMKIIYLFKNLETCMKAVLMQAYPDGNFSTTYRADNLASAVASLGVKIKEIDGYEEYNQLRTLNNNIKHSRDIGGDTKQIPEFKKLDVIASGTIIKFYNRVKKKVILFSEGFAEAIINSAFVYSDERLTEISKSYLGKMDRATAQKFSDIFAQQLKDRYTIKP